MKSAVRTAARALALCGTLVTISQFAGNAARADDTVSATVEQYVAEANIEGAVLVARDGEPIYRAAFGLANREWQVENTPDTRFRIASMTKSFTAVLVMQLVQEGLIDLEAPFKTYLPSYPSENGDRITVRQLLTHRSGIPHYAELPGWRDGRFRPDITPEDFIAVFAARPLNFEPGSERRYSNSNFYLLGLIIEKLRGMPYGQALEKHILTPAGMTESGDFSGGEVIANLAADYMRNGEEISCAPKSAPYCASGYVNMDLFRATGSLHSNVDDLLKWDQALYAEAILTDESKAILFNAEDPFAWSVGALPLDDEGRTVDVIAYNGGINGYTSLIVRFPKARDTVIVLANNGTSYGTLVGLAQKVAVALYPGTDQP